MLQASRQISDSLQCSAEIKINSCRALCDFRGVLFLPDSQTLIVSDLHLEKGAAFARRGLMHPPYDTSNTLSKLADCVRTYQPRLLVSLGDSFHDKDGPENLPNPYLRQLRDIQSACEWVWIAGNHDPVAPKNLGGAYLEELCIEKLILRHEPTSNATAGEISGHLHPAACITRRGKTVRRFCFASDEHRLIMPAFGATTGGLSLKHRAFSGHFNQSKLCAHVMGQEQVYSIPACKMRG